MNWTDRFLKLAALVLAISLGCVWFSLVFLPDHNDPLPFFLLASTACAAVLVLDKLFGADSAAGAGMARLDRRQVGNDGRFEDDGSKARIALVRPEAGHAFEQPLAYRAIGVVIV